MSSIWNLLKILLALGLVLYVLSKSDVSDLTSTLQNASLFWLVISGALYFLLTLLKALQYSVLLRGRLTYPQVLNVIIWQNAVSNFFLTGAGIAAYITMARLEYEVKVSRSVTTFLLTKVGDLIAIWMVLLVASGLVWSEIGALQTPVVLLLAGIGSILLLFFLTISFRLRFISALQRVVEKLQISGVKFVEDGMSYLQSLAGMEQNKILPTLGLLILYSFIYLVVTTVFTYTSLAIFHLQPSMSAVMFVNVLMQLVSYFPVAVFGGLGITETSALYLWSFFDIQQEVLAPALIGSRIVFYLFNLIPLIYLPAYSVFSKAKEQAQNGQ
jgi:uncharacterized membrane protein YbhN (UPF0104 family)